MLRTLMHVLAVVALVVMLAAIGIRVGGGPAGVADQPTLPLRSQLKPVTPTPKRFPTIGETPTFLEARRYITPHLQLELAKLDT
jgi:hypothetical protein